jgi:hypothetical protein
MSVVIGEGAILVAAGMVYIYVYGRVRGAFYCEIQSTFTLLGFCVLLITVGNLERHQTTTQPYKVLKANELIYPSYLRQR